MLVVKVELHSAINGLTSEIARFVVYNDSTGDRDRGNYVSIDLNDHPNDMSVREATRRAIMCEPGYAKRRSSFKGYERAEPDVLHLISIALQSMGYGIRGKDKEIVSSASSD